jgi:hypothetical protein
MNLWYILCSLDIPIFRSFGIFCGLLVYFPRFGITYQEKSGKPGFGTGSICHALGVDFMNHRFIR